MANYPETCPEGATEVTEPIHYMTFDVRTGNVEIEFAPGEHVTISMIDVQGGALAATLFIEAVAHYLSSTRPMVTWASPAVIAKTFSDAGLDENGDKPRSPDKAPF